MGLLQFQLPMARRKYHSPISKIAEAKQKTDSAVKFPFLSLAVVITYVRIPSCWVIEAFYQVFPGILPQAAERTANRTLRIWQKTEGEGFMLGVSGGGTKEEKLCLRACLQLRALQWCWVLPSEPEKEIWGTAL